MAPLLNLEKWHGNEHFARGRLARALFLMALWLYGVIYATIDTSLPCCFLESLVTQALQACHIGPLTWKHLCHDHEWMNNVQLFLYYIWKLYNIIVMRKVLKGLVIILATHSSLLTRFHAYYWLYIKECSIFI